MTGKEEALFAPTCFEFPVMHYSNPSQSSKAKYILWENINDPLTNMFFMICSVLWRFLWGFLFSEDNLKENKAGLRGNLQGYFRRQLAST